MIAIEEVHWLIGEHPGVSKYLHERLISML